MSAVGTVYICSLTPLIFSETLRPLLSVLGNHVRREVVISSHLPSSPLLMTPFAASTEFTKQDLPHHKFIMRAKTLCLILSGVRFYNHCVKENDAFAAGRSRFYLHNFGIEI